MRIIEILKEDADISALQSALKAAGADLGIYGVDGHMGPWTRSAAEKFPEIAKKFAGVLAKPDSPLPANFKMPPDYKSDSGTVKPGPNPNLQMPPNPKPDSGTVKPGPNPNIDNDTRDRATLQVNGVANNGSRTSYGGTAGIVFHHTASARGLTPGINNVNGVITTFKSRGVSSNFVIDRDGKVYTIVPDDLSTNHVKYVKGNKLNNGNAIGVEVIAADDSDVTPEQVSAGKKLGQDMMNKYKFGPEGVAGHGQLAGQDRMPSEGATIVAALGGKYNNRA